MTLSTIKEKLNKVLWESNLDSLPKLQVESIKLLRIFQAVIRDLSGGLPTLRAMSLVYTTLLSLVPLLAVSFSVLKGFGVHNQIEPALLHILEPLGDQGAEITRHIIGFVDNIKVGILGIMGIALLFYTVISLLQKIERAFNYTWRITEYRRVTQRFSEYLSVIMVGPVLVITALAITAAINSSSVVTLLSEIEPFGSLIHLAGKLLPYILVITAFTFIYILIPNTKVQFRSALTGAVIAGILWEATGWLFASFVAGSTNYTAIYSGFAILIIFMIWLYLSWLILLVGASISFYHQHPECITTRQKILGLSARLREKIALLVMFRIGKSFHDNEKPWTLNNLSHNLDVASEAIILVLKSLHDNKLITKSYDNNIITYMPSHSLEHISIESILTAARVAEESSHLNMDKLDHEPAIDTLISNIDASVNNMLNNMSLRDLITGSIKK
jgi:membrane protein